MRYMASLAAAVVAALLAPTTTVAGPYPLPAPPTPPRTLAASAPHTIPMPPQTVYVLGINSPLLQLTPTVLGPPSQTWNMSYSNISNSNFTPGMISLGQASYVTTMAGTTGASLTFQFVGTGVTLLGSAGYFDVLDWRVDNTSSSNPVGSSVSDNQNIGFGWEAQVAWAWDLAWGLHTCTLVVQTTYDKVVLMQALVLTGIQGAVLTDSPTDPLRQITPAVDGVGAPNKALNTTGKWEVHTPDEGDVVTRAAFPVSGYTVLRTNTTGSLRYVLPKRTSYVEVWGSTGWGFANYTVTLTPAPPFDPPVITYAAHTAYYVPAYILSWAILDPAVDYVLEFKAYGGWAEVYNVQYFLASATSAGAGDSGKPAGSGVSISAMAGGIAGAFVAGLAVAALIGFALFRSYKKKQPSPPPVFEVDNTNDARPRPFYHDDATPAPGARTPELVPLMSEMQGYGDGVLGLSAATASSGHDAGVASPPGRSRRPTTDEASSTSGGASRHSSSRHTGGSMHVVNDFGAGLAPVGFKTPRASLGTEAARRGAARAPLPIAVQERDSGAQVIHIVEYVPPAYDASLPHSSAGGSVVRDNTVADDPTKPGGVRPLPPAPF